MQKWILFINLLASFSIMGQAIKFGRFGEGLEYQGNYTPVRSILYDTIDKKLYAAGQFNKSGYGLPVWGVSVWNGIKWDSLGGGFTQTPHVIPGNGSPTTLTTKIIRFQNKIYFIGGIIWVNGKNQYNMAVWNGTNWDYPIAEPPNGVVRDLMVYNGALYACGEFSKFGNTDCKYIAKFDGVSWQPVGDFTKYYKNASPPSSVLSIQAFNNEIYIGGQFDDSTSTPKNIAKFDGSRWRNVGTGIEQGGTNWVGCLERFNNKLYIGGRFSKTAQIPAHSLIAWNGSSYEDVSTVQIPNCTVNFLKAHKNKIWAIGAFISNPISVTNLFYLDANGSGCGLDMASTFNDPNFYAIERCDFKGDSLIVGGLFKYLDTVKVNNIGFVTNYTTNANCAVVGVKENEKNIISKDPLVIYPNPTDNSITINLKASKPYTIKVYNSLGQVVYLEIVKETDKPEYTINLSGLTKGIYFINVSSEEINKTAKIIKE